MKIYQEILVRHFYYRDRISESEKIEKKGLAKFTFIQCGSIILGIVSEFKPDDLPKKK